MATKFTIRTVRNGAVKIGGSIFRPREYYYMRDDYELGYLEPYNNELEGLRIAFARYMTGGSYDAYVALWSSAEYYRADEYKRDELRDLEPNLIDGGYVWDWWYTEDEWQRRKLTLDSIGV